MGRALGTVLSFLLVPGGALAAEPDPSALAPRSTYVLDLPFLHFDALTGDVPEPGRVAWRLSGNYSNTFSHTYHANAIKRELGTIGTPFSLAEAEIEHERHFYETIIFIDAEVLRTALTAELGLARGVSVALEVPYLSFSTVSADRAIIAFHRAFGLSQAQRTDYPPGGFLVVLQAPYGPLAYDDRRPADGFGDAVVSARWRHPLGTGVDLSADAALKLPIGSARDYRGSGSADAGAMLGLTATRGRQTWYLQAGGVVPGRWRGPLPYQPAPFGRLLIGTGRTLGASARTTAGFCLTVEGSPLNRERLRSVSEPAVEVSLGISRVVAAWGSIDLTVNEHLPRFGDGTDVGVRLALRATLPERRPRP